MRSTIDLRGDFLSTASYAAMARELYYAFSMRLGVQVRLEHVPTSDVVLQSEQQIMYQLQTSQGMQPSPIKIHLGPPPYSLVPNSVNILWSVFNSRYPNEQLLAAWKQFNMVIISCANVYNKIKAQNPNDGRYFYFPLPVDTNIYSSNGFPLAVLNVTHDLDGQEKKNKPYIFGITGTWTVRSNMESVIRAYMSAFTDKDNVALLVKATDVRRVSSDAVKHQIADIRNKVRNPSSPKVYVIPGGSSDNDYAQFVSACDCIIDVSKWDSLHTAMHHAFACEKIVICQDYNGEVEYCSSDTALTVNSYLEPIYDPQDSTSKFGEEWYTTSVSSIISAMKKAYASKDNSESFKKRKKKALEYIQNVCESDKVAYGICEALSGGVKFSEPDAEVRDAIRAAIESHKPISMDIPKLESEAKLAESNA